MSEIIHTMCDPIVRMRHICGSHLVPICDSERPNEKGTEIGMMKEQQTTSTECKGKG